MDTQRHRQHAEAWTPNAPSANTAFHRRTIRETGRDGFHAVRDLSSRIWGRGGTRPPRN
jgi:hypothetical protein